MAAAGLTEVAAVVDQAASQTERHGETYETRMASETREVDLGSEDVPGRESVGHDDVEGLGAAHRTHTHHMDGEVDQLIRIA